MEILAQYQGLLGAVLLIVAFLTKLIKPNARSIGVKYGFFTGCVVVSFIPVGGLAIAEYACSIIGNLSIMSCLLIAVYLLREYANKELIPASEFKCLMISYAVVGLVFYPPTLGFGPIDPYSWGYRSQFMALALLATGGMLVWVRFNATCLLISLSVVAYLGELASSRNLWDYLMDPVLWIYSVICSVGYLYKGLIKDWALRITKNMNLVEKVSYMAGAVLLLVGFAMSYIDHEWFAAVYVVEDGIAEWLTVVALAAGMGVCFWRVAALWRERSILFLSFTFLYGLVFLFGAGEEISWGQRIFNTESSRFFLENNAQRETNLHNLVVGGVKINKLIFGKGIAIFMVLYLLVFPPVYRRRKGFAEFFDKLGVPVPQWHQVVICIVMFIIAQVLMTSSKKGEMSELAGAMNFVIIFSYPYNKAVFARREK